MQPWCLEIMNKIDAQQVEINKLKSTVRQLIISKNTLEDENERIANQIKNLHKNDLKKTRRTC